MQLNSQGHILLFLTSFCIMFFHFICSLCRQRGIKWKEGAFEDSRVCSIMGFSELVDASATHASLGIRPLEPINFGKTGCNYVLSFGLQCPFSWCTCKIRLRVGDSEIKELHRLNSILPTIRSSKTSRKGRKVISHEIFLGSHMVWVDVIELWRDHRAWKMSEISGSPPPPSLRASPVAQYYC